MSVKIMSKIFLLLNIYLILILRKKKVSDAFCVFYETYLIMLLILGCLSP